MLMCELCILFDGRVNLEMELLQKGGNLMESQSTSAAKKQNSFCK